MSKIRKAISVFLWILLISAIVTGYITFRNRFMKPADLLSAVPSNSAILIEFSSFYHFLENNHDNLVWKEFAKVFSPELIPFDLALMDSVLSREAFFRELFSRPLTMSLLPLLNGSPGILFFLPGTQSQQIRTLTKNLNLYLPELTISKRSFSGYSLYDLSWEEPEGTRNFSLAIVKGVIVGSFYSELVEESIKHFISGSRLTESNGFEKVYQTAGRNVPVRVFINYTRLSTITWSARKKSKVSDESTNREFALWGGFDAELLKESLVLNGFTSIDDTLNLELNLFSGQEPVEFNSPGFLPEHICRFFLFGFSDKNKFYNNLTEYLIKEENSAPFHKAKQDLKKTYNIDIGLVITELMNDEYGYADFVSGTIRYPVCFIELKSQSLAEQQFSSWLTSWATMNGVSFDELNADYRIDNNTSFKVYKFPPGGIPAMLFGKRFYYSGSDYFAFINNYMVFGNSFAILKDFLYQVILGNNMVSGVSYKALGDNILSRSNFYEFSDPSRLSERNHSSTQKTEEDLASKIDHASEKFNAISNQYSAADELMYNRIYFHYEGSAGGNVSTIWQSRLDTVTASKPAIVTNHITGEKEIIVVDLKNQVYLLSHAGIILWKQMMDNPVLSEIYQIDYYGNGKKQYLFSTQNKIYLIDRNGNPVEKFPVELRASATSGISVFDYDSNGDLRICVPCEDRKIYMYNKEGKVLTGWQTPRTDNPVIRPIQHFRVGDKDYLVATDRYKFYFYDRKGNTRVNFSKYFQASASNLFYLDSEKGNEPARLVTTDTAGSVYRVYFTGRIEKILDQSIGSDHFFVFQDLNGDRKGELLIAHSNRLKVYNPTLTEIMNIEFPDLVSFRPVTYNFSSDNNKIGIVLGNSGIIYLYNNNGTLYKGFPLEGSGPFSISSFPGLGKGFSLIVGTKKNFLYNYSVQ